MNDPASDAANASPGEKIAERYEIRRAIGSGGSGSVFQAWDLQLQRFVAVKRWNPPEPLLDDPEGTERLWREAMTLAAIQHPNILTIHDFGVDGKGPYVITEFVDGETLDVVVKRAPFGVDEFADAAQQTLEALIAAHQAGLIHRDLKPQNIMRTRLASGAWQYKILDFGLARFVSQPTVQSMENNKSIYGSILYIAPEQLRHQPLDARTDIYAIGCVFYYMLSGHSAVEGESIPDLITSHLQHNVKPLAELRPELPATLSDWVMKALSYAPDDRYPSAAAALAALRKVLPGAIRQTSFRVGAAAPTIRLMPTPTHPPIQKTAALPVAPPPAAPRAAPPRWAVALAAVVLLGVAATAFLLPRPAAAPEAATAPAPAAQTLAASWRDEALPVEDVITVWPASIAEARRPLIQKYFEMLRDLDDPKWGSIGTILETLATLQHNSRNDPKKSRAYCNLTYHDATNRTLGEIDVMIWNVPEQRAEIVYEAVVSDQLNRKAVSSRNQIQRFADCIQSGVAVKILDPHDAARKFEPAQFANAKVAIMGNQGALAAGFDAEIDITRFENDYLQRRLIDWRKAKQAQTGKKKKPRGEVPGAAEASVATPAP
ncbi:MAG: serine/threonine-protein kinase [Kiritimatiellia bacterium]